MGSFSREWDHVWEGFWGAPEYSANDWDEFDEGFSDLVDREREDEDPSRLGERPDTVLVLILRSPEFLRDEPDEELRNLMGTMRLSALGIDPEERGARAELRVLFQCEPEKTEALKERLARAGVKLEGGKAGPGPEPAMDDVERKTARARMSWEGLPGSGGRGRDGRWARLVTGTGQEVEGEVRAFGREPPEGGVHVGVLRGERCRSEAGFFEECARSLGFPDWFGRNWDAFNDSFSELVERELPGQDAPWERERPDAVVVLVSDSQNLLRDEPETKLQTLVFLMRSVALGLRWEDKNRPRLAELRVLFQCEDGEAPPLGERLTRARLDL